MNLDILNKLQQMGFSANLARTFLWVIEHDQTKAGELIKGVGLHRSVVYGALEELEARGLVTKIIKKGVSTYSVNDLSVLVHELELKKDFASTIVKEIESERHREERTTTTYEGRDVIARIADKTLQIDSGQTVYFLGSSKFGIQSSLEKFWEKYHARRGELKISCKILYDKNTPADLIKKRNESKLCEAKFLPFGEDLPMSYVIYGDTVAMIVPAENPPIAFVIKSKLTAEAVVQYFNYLWNQA